MLSDLGVPAALGEMSLEDIEAALGRLADATAAGAKPRSAQPLRVLVAGAAVHGFREPHVTTPRSRRAAAAAAAHLQTRGWRWLDLFPPTAARDDGTLDGVHYKPEMCETIVQLALNLALNG